MSIPEDIARMIDDAGILIGKCLTATAPSAEIDGRMLALLDGRILKPGTYTPTASACLLARNVKPPHDEYVVWAEGPYRDFNVPRFSGSLDACVEALEKRFSGMMWEKRIDGTVIVKRAAEHSHEIVGGFAPAKSVCMSFCIALASAKVSELRNSLLVTAGLADSEVVTLPDLPGRPDTAPYIHEIGEGELITVAEYIASVADDSLIDDDGFGYPVKDGRCAKGDEDDFPGLFGLVPSQGLQHLPRDASHVIWFNT